MDFPGWKSHSTRWLKTATKFCSHGKRYAAISQKIGQNRIRIKDRIAVYGNVLYTVV